MDDLIWRPMISVATIVVVCLAAAALSIAVALKRERVTIGDGLRLLAIALLGAALANPGFDRSAEIEKKPDLIAVVDLSSSMALRDAGEDGSRRRIDVMKETWLNARIFNELRWATNLSALSATDRVTAPDNPFELLTRDPGGDETALLDALRTAVASVGAGGRVLALTDGIDTTESPLSLEAIAAAAQERNVRIDAVVAGGQAPAPDASIRVGARPDVVFPGQASVIRIDVIERGLSGRTARLTLTEQRADAEETVFDETVTLGVDRRIDVPVQPAAGGDAGSSIAVYRVHLAPLEIEADESNNTRHAFIQTLEKPARLLVLEAAPYWETTFFIRAAADDPRIDVVSMTALDDNRVRTQRFVPAAVAARPMDTEPISMTEDELFGFDVVALGRGVERWFGGERADLLRRFVVERGGGVIFLRGDPVAGDGADASILREVANELSPVRFGEGYTPGGRLALTEDGEREAPFDSAAGALSSALRDLPEMIASVVVSDRKPLSVVWMRSAGDGPADEGSPAVASLRIGRGRTLAVLSDGLWRWAVAPASSSAPSGIHQAFWSSAINWMAFGGEVEPGKLLSVRAESGVARPGQRMSIVVRARHTLEARPEVIVRTPDGEQWPIVMDQPREAVPRWVGTFTPRDEGVYEASALAPGMDGEGDETRFGVYESRLELLDTAPRRKEMRALAEATGGRLHDLADAERYAAEFARTDAAVESPTGFEPVWSRAWVFGIIVGLLAGSWLINRRAGDA